MRNFLYSLLILALASCGGEKVSSPANQLAGNDFESVDGWVGDNTPTSLTKEKAHSGRYSVKVDPAIEFSMGYNNLLGKLSSSKLRKIKIKAWVNIPSGKAESMIVASVTDPASNNSLMWTGTKLIDQVKVYNKWVEFEKEIALPENVTYSHKLSVYLWRTGANETAFVDDLTIEKVD